MKVVITDYEYENIDQERRIFAQAGIELADYHCKTDEELIAATRDADAVITQYCYIGKNIIDKMEHCKVISRYGIGVNNIDIDAATEKGIYVCNVPDYGIDEVSNHAIAMLLSLAKKLPIISKALRGGEWGYAGAVPLFRLSEATVGLVGFGRIPKMIAKKLRAFEVKLLAYDPYVTQEQASEFGVTMVDLDTLCKESDFISLHCPQTKETEGLFDLARFKMMKNTAFLINTSRGPVVCEKDLITALENKEIAGAALDVFEKEPVDKDSALLQLDNVIATPHCAWYSEESILALQRIIAEETVAILQGQPPKNIINRSLLQK